MELIKSIKKINILATKDILTTIYSMLFYLINKSKRNNIPYKWEHHDCCELFKGIKFQFHCLLSLVYLPLKKKDCSLVQMCFDNEFTFNY